MPPAEVLLTFGRNVRAQREKLKLSQQTTAETAGISITYLGKVERAQANVTLEIADRICKVLKVKLTAMLQ